jgi:hypothetical protein
MKRIPEIEKLKDRIVDLPHEEAEALQVWLSAITGVRREDKKRAESKKEGNQK